MFFFCENLKTLLRIHPQYMHKAGDMPYLMQQLINKVEGNCYQGIGYVILVNRDT